MKLQHAIYFAFVGITFGVLLPACSPESMGGPNAVYSDPGSINFGTIGLGGRPTGPSTIVNGTVNSYRLAYRFTNVAFSLSDLNSDPDTLLSSHQFTIVIQFAPKTTGEYLDTLFISDFASDKLLCTLLLRGAAVQ